MTHLTFDPRIPLVLWAPLAAVAALMLVVYAIACRRRIAGRRWVGMLLLMALAVALPLGILLNPTWVEQLPPPAGKPRLTILVDTSASMATADCDDERTRYDMAREFARRMSNELTTQFDTRIRQFNAYSGPVTFEQLAAQEPTGASSNLGAAIETALDDQPQGQAFLLLSDGVHNTGNVASLRKSVEQARAMAAPVYVRTFGRTTGARDLEVRVNLPQEMAFVGQKISAVLSLTQRGALAVQTRMSVLLDGKILEQRDVDLVTDGTTETTFQVGQDSSGLYRYEFRADSLTDEVTAVNNSATMLLRVVNEPVRVLFLEGKPYWDTKFLIRTLAADQSVELVSVVRMTEGRFLERRIARPTRDVQSDETELDGAKESTSHQPNDDAARQEEWNIHRDAKNILADAKTLASYQIVVLGRNSESYLTDEALVQLKKWLVQGDGSLVCFRGPPASQLSQQLGDLMPVRWSPARESRFRLQLTDSGRSMHWLPGAQAAGGALSELPSLATVARAERVKPLAVVLATASGGNEGQQVPVITYQPVGSGYVVVVEGAGMWRWAFLPPTYQERDEAYGLLWRSLLRWLVANAGLLPSQQVSLRTDRTTFSTNEVAAGSILLREGGSGDSIVNVRLTGDASFDPRTITAVPTGAVPGQFRVIFGKLPEGIYHARVEGFGENESAAETAFDVRDNLAERLDVAARADVMGMIAKRSGGAVLEDEDPEALASYFQEYLKASLPKRFVRNIAWDRWWVLTMVFLAWASVWGLRRASGLI